MHYVEVLRSQAVTGNFLMGNYFKAPFTIYTISFDITMSPNVIRLRVSNSYDKVLIYKHFPIPDIHPNKLYDVSLEIHYGQEFKCVAKLDTQEYSISLENI